ncbi:MAG: S24 family peptidase [Gemmatimonadota bacterium]|nr:S24 family peptidase [Gemmatimonadota bacterium]
MLRKRDNGQVAWNEGEQRRALHAQLGKTMGEFLDLSNVPERGRIAIVAKITHRARQGVSRWFKQDRSSGALPDTLSIFLFAQAFQADANYLLGLTDRRRVLRSTPDGSAPGQQAARSDADHLLELAREIGERFPANGCVTMVGDEMEPTIKRGTKVWLDTSYAAIQGNGIYALEIDGRTIVRIVEDRPGEGFTLSCENKRYREQVIPSRTNLAQSGVKVVGKVVGWFQLP